jgi:hypothetical protein
MWRRVIFRAVLLPAGAWGWNNLSWGRGKEVKYGLYLLGLPKVNVDPGVDTIASMLSVLRL